MKHVIYGDTDSVYVTISELVKLRPEWSNDNVIEIADNIGDVINSQFPEFVDKSFLVGKERGKIIKAGRETVGRRGIFKDKKKRYAIYVLDSEGHKPESGKDIKIAGMETQRSDTPKDIQKFLKSCITFVIKENKGYEELLEYVTNFKQKFRNKDLWKQGTPSRLSNLSIKEKELQIYENAVANGEYRFAKPLVYWVIQASMNTNALITQNEEHRWDLIKEGDKVEVLYLLDNPYDFKSVAIKTEETYVPDWFKELPFDKRGHEKKMIDKKLSNIFGAALGWSFEPIEDYRNEIFEEVDFFE